MDEHGGDDQEDVWGSPIQTGAAGAAAKKLINRENSSMNSETWVASSTEPRPPISSALHLNSHGHSISRTATPVSHHPLVNGHGSLGLSISTSSINTARRRASVKNRDFDYDDESNSGLASATGSGSGWNSQTHSGRSTPRAPLNNAGTGDDISVSSLLCSASRSLSSPVPKGSTSSVSPRLRTTPDLTPSRRSLELSEADPNINSNSLQRRSSSPATTLNGKGKEKEEKQIQVIVHELQKTDTIASVSLMYGITPQAIRTSNRMWSNDSIHNRKVLRIPLDLCQLPASSTIIQTNRLVGGGANVRSGVSMNSVNELLLPNPSVGSSNGSVSGLSTTEPSPRSSFDTPPSLYGSSNGERGGYDTPSTSATTLSSAINSDDDLVSSYLPSTNNPYSSSTSSSYYDSNSAATVAAATNGSNSTLHLPDTPSTITANPSSMYTSQTILGPRPIIPSKMPKMWQSTSELIGWTSRSTSPATLCENEKDVNGLDRTSSPQSGSTPSRHSPFSSSLSSASSSEHREDGRVNHGGGTGGTGMRRVVIESVPESALSFFAAPSVSSSLEEIKDKMRYSDYDDHDRTPKKNSKASKPTLYSSSSSSSSSLYSSSPLNPKQMSKTGPNSRTSSHYRKPSQPFNNHSSYSHRTTSTSGNPASSSNGYLSISSLLTSGLSKFSHSLPTLGDYKKWELTNFGGEEDDALWSNSNTISSSHSRRGHSRTQDHQDLYSHSHPSRRSQIPHHPSVKSSLSANINLDTNNHHRDYSDQLFSQVDQQDGRGRANLGLINTDLTRTGGEVNDRKNKTTGTGGTSSSTTLYRD